MNGEGYQAQCQKIQGIFYLKPPNNQEALQGFVGMVNVCKEMYPKRLMLMTPLTNMTEKGKKFVCAEEHQKAFNFIKRAVS